MAKSKGYASFVGKIGIGFDPVLDLLAAVNSTTTIEDVTSIPPYNIKKTADGGYTLELDVTGVDKADVKVTLDADSLIIEATTKIGFDASGNSSDIYFHQGILAGGQVSAKFLVAHNLKFKDANLVDGILSIDFTDTNTVRDLETLAIGPFPKSDIAYTVEYNSAGSPIAVPVGSSVESDDAVPLELPTAQAQADVAAGADPTALNTPVVDDTPPPDVAVPTTPVVVNADTPAMATVTVDTPTVVPAVVEATVSNVSAAVDPTSAAPQATVTLTDATNGASPGAMPIATIPTPDGSPDVVVKATAEATAAAANAGIDLPSVVSATLDHPDVSVGDAVAPTVDVPVNVGNPVAASATVQLPVDLPQIVTAEATAVKPVVDQQAETPQATVVVSDATHELPDNVVTDVAKTPDGSADVVVAVDADHQAEMKAQGVDVLQSAVAAIEAAPAGVDLPTPPPVATDATADSAPADVKVQPSDATADPVTVSVPDVLPSVVQATADPDTNTVTLTPAHDVPDDATLTPVVTAPDQHDIVVATTPDTDKTLVTMGVDVGTDVSTAVIAAATPVVTSADVPATVDPTVDTSSSTQTTSAPDSGTVSAPVVDASIPPSTTDSLPTPPVDAPVADTPPVVAPVQIDATSASSDAPVANTPVVSPDSTVSTPVETPAPTETPAPDAPVADSTPAPEAAPVVVVPPVSTDPTANTQ